jgi:hypothetical protein
MFSCDLVHKVMAVRNPSTTLACAGSAGSGVSNTWV